MVETSRSIPILLVSQLTGLVTMPIRPPSWKCGSSPLCIATSSGRYIAVLSVGMMYSPDAPQISRLSRAEGCPGIGPPCENGNPTGCTPGAPNSFATSLNVPMIHLLTTVSITKRIGALALSRTSSQWWPTASDVVANARGIASLTMNISGSKIADLSPWYSRLIPIVQPRHDSEMNRPRLTNQPPSSFTKSPSTPNNLTRKATFSDTAAAMDSHTYLNACSHSHIAMMPSPLIAMVSSLKAMTISETATSTMARAAVNANLKGPSTTAHTSRNGEVNGPANQAATSLKKLTNGPVNQCATATNGAMNGPEKKCPISRKKLMNGPWNQWPTSTKNFRKGPANQRPISSNTVRNALLCS